MKYDIIKRKEALINNNLDEPKNMRLSETYGQSQRATYCMMPFIRNVQNRQIHSEKIN